MGLKARGLRFAAIPIPAARRLVLSGLVLAALLLAAACNGSPPQATASISPSPSPFVPVGETLFLSVDLRDPGTWVVDGPSCWGAGAYADISGGTAVVVRNENNEILQSGQLKPGRVAPGSCHFLASVSGIATAKSYSVQIGHRQPVVRTLGELVVTDWQLALDFGG